MSEKDESMFPILPKKHSLVYSNTLLITVTCMGFIWRFSTIMSKFRIKNNFIKVILTLKVVLKRAL